MAKKNAPKKKAVKKPVKKAVAKPVAKKAAAKPLPKKVAAKPILKKAVAPAKKPVVAAKAAPKKAAAPVAKPAPAPAKKGAKAAPIPKVVVEKAAKKEKVAKVEPEIEELEAPGEGEEEESDEVVLTDAEGRRYCRVKDCDQLSSVDGYCRYHYLLFWKRIQVRKKILTEGKLERYIEELTARYPDKFLDMLRKDLRSDKEFLAAIAELEIDESANENEFEDEAQTYIDEVRGMGEPTARGDDEDF